MEITTFEAQAAITARLTTQALRYHQWVLAGELIRLAERIAVDEIMHEVDQCHTRLMSRVDV